MKYILMGIVALLFLKAGWVRIEKWQATRETANATRGAQESQLAQSQLGKLWDTLDWSVTTPGKALGDLIGPEWVNWVLWGLIILIILSILGRIAGLIFGPKTSSLGIGQFLNSLFNKVIWGMVAFGVVAGSIYVYFSLNPSGPPTVERINLKNTGDPDDWVGMARMGPKTVLEITVPTSNSRQHGDQYFAGCIQVVDPKKTEKKIILKPIGGSPIHKYVLDEEAQRLMMDYSLPTIGVKVTLVLAAKDHCSSLR